MDAWSFPKYIVLDIIWQSSEIQKHYRMKLEDIQSTGKGVRYIHVDTKQATCFMKGKSDCHNFS